MSAAQSSPSLGVNCSPEDGGGTECPFRMSKTIAQCPSAPPFRGLSLQLWDPEWHNSHKKTPIWDCLHLGGVG